MNLIKNNMNIFTKLIVAILLLPSISFSQDIHFSQYLNSPLTLNPALAGMYKGDVRVFMNYKTQWASVATTEPYKTFAMSYDVALMKKKWSTGFLGTGVSFFRDKAGDAEMGTTQIALSLSSMKSFNRHNDFSVGLQAAFVQKSANYDNLVWENQYDGTGFDQTLSSNEVFSSNNFNYADVAAGINWNYGKGDKYSIVDNKLKANAGIAIFHANHPKQGFYGIKDDKMYSKLTIYGNMFIPLKEQLSVKPSFLVLKQGPTQEIILGGMLRYALKNYEKGAAVSFGTYYRAGDAFIVASQLEYTNYTLGISYDVNVSKLRTVTSSQGGFELSLRFKNPNPFKDLKEEKISRF